MRTLAGVLDGLNRQGFTEHFAVRGQRLRGFESGRTFGAQDVVIQGYERFEGISDPDDMAIVYAIETVNRGPRGTLVDAFGVYSDPAVGAFLDQVIFRRRTLAA